MCRAARLALALSLPSLALVAQDGAAGRLPNVVIFIADDMTYTDLGCWGNDEVRTPNLDRLATEGMRLTRCYTPAPMCAPTRAALYSGIFPVRNGAHPNHSRVHDDVETMPHHLGRLGYRVALTGKTHFKPATNFPFEILRAKGRLAWEKVEEFIGRKTDQPYRLIAASRQPHTPWNKGDASKYDAGALTLPPYLVDTAETREAFARYYAEIEFLDGEVGRCLEIVDKSEQAANTLFLFLSEQGSAFPHCKWTCYETGIRAATIARWPGVVEAGSESAALVQYPDVLPTIVDAAGAEPVEGLDGRSFLAVLRGEADAHREYVYAVQTSRGISNGPQAYGVRSISDGRFKLIWNLNPANEFSNNITSGKEISIFRSWRAAGQTDQRAASLVSRFLRRPEFELYDLESDPFELDALSSSDHEERVAALRTELRRFMTQQGDEGAATEAAAKERQGNRRR